jgi:formylglycine-generating enzyme required for sulfatase activity
MAVLFVSHSSKDDAAVAGLEAWLHIRGFTDLFIDHNNISGGEKWAQALRDASGACRVIICLVTEHWLASDECFGEFKAAWYMGKRIVPLLGVQPGSGVFPERLAKVLAEDQGFNIAGCMTAEGGLDLSLDALIERRLEIGLRASGALARIGLDPEAFPVDQKLRPVPFPGLSSFSDDDADAALFYGRSREIAETLEELRQVRAVRDLRPFVIIGASGAGKSSLLRAGIIPRLRREVPAWLPLRAFRPGTDPLFNLAEAISRTLRDFGRVEAAGVIRDRLLSAWFRAERGASGLTVFGRKSLEAALEAEGCALRETADRIGATILVSIDQAEEMTRVEGESADALADYLRAALTATSPWQLAFTIRADSLNELQNHRRFRELNARAYDLRAIRSFRFDSVVEEPAKRYGVSVSSPLVDALVEDAPEEDALPLLAFALQRLWHQYAASGALTKDNYDKVGGLRGLIEDAAERALRLIGPQEDVALPSGPPSKHRLDLAASTFVPALVQINEKGAIVRRIAEWSTFNDEQQDLLIRFDQWRLVVRKGDADGGTVEVAHEALFREWTRLKSWLEPERARLDALRSLQIDASTWQRNGRDPAFLNHRENRLVEAVTLTSIEHYRKHLGVVEFDYLAACEAAERLAQRRARRIRELIYVLLIGIIAVLVGWINQSPIKAKWRWYWTERPFAAANIWPRVLDVSNEQAKYPQDNFRECLGELDGKDYCPKMVVIPAGPFQMGSPNGVGNASEHPAHFVTIARPFAVSESEVTFEEWDTCVAYGECDSHVSDHGWGRGQQPVIYVTWAHAQQYVTWLSKMTGRPYRLLSDAEYEYAARGGNLKATYPWGDELGTNNANCNGCGSRWDDRRTAPVKSFAANGFGLYDMVGNVLEWVQDCFHSSYEVPASQGNVAAPTDGSVWEGGDCTYHVVRGGSWDGSPANVRSAFRVGGVAETRDGNLGFRVGRTLLTH